MSGLARVARDATERLWMQRSYSTDDEGHRHYLVRERGWCCAWAAECLAHAFQPQSRRPNLRHAQDDFPYHYASADSWGRAVRRGNDLGVWRPKTQVAPLAAGDMIFWLKGVNGYTYRGGHVAIVVEVGPRGGVLVSENSSTGGIGTHGISAYRLSKMAGVFRWTTVELPYYPETVKVVQLPGHEHHAEAWLFDGHYLMRVRDAARITGQDLVEDHIIPQKKVYFKPR